MRDYKSAGTQQRRATARQPGSGRRWRRLGITALVVLLLVVGVWALSQRWPPPLADSTAARTTDGAIPLELPPPQSAKRAKETTPNGLMNDQ